jgi:hypothetical protein
LRVPSASVSYSLLRFTYVDLHDSNVYLPILNLAYPPTNVHTYLSSDSQCKNHRSLCLGSHLYSKFSHCPKDADPSLRARMPSKRLYASPRFCVCCSLDGSLRSTHSLSLSATLFRLPVLPTEKVPAWLLQLCVYREETS